MGVTKEGGVRREFIPSQGVARKFPTNRDKPMGRVEDWLLGKQQDDGAEGLWRIHDELYDLTTWITKHPGGQDWIEVTRGTDVTEAFECHHLTDNASKLLPKFHVRKAATLRNSMVTFHEKGLYQTLKRRIRNAVTETGPTWKSTILTDSFLVGYLVCGVLATVHSQWWCIPAGVILQMLVVASHNFFHMKDNFRMYYFNLSGMSFREWRVSHALSHHLYPNTILDLEVSMFEPVFQYLPSQGKSLINRYLPWIISPGTFITLFYLQFFRRIIDVVSSRKLGFRADDLVCITFPVALTLLTGSGMLHCFHTWSLIILAGSLAFGLVGLTAAHHHPEIYHEGDHLGEDKDFGMLQLAAVRDRIEVSGNFFLVMITFGDHALHHMFPTLDHGRLHSLYPILEETCKEFGIQFKLLHTWEMVTGMYLQLARNYKHSKLMITENNS